MVRKLLTLAMGLGLAGGAIVCSPALADTKPKDDPNQNPIQKINDELLNKELLGGQPGDDATLIARRISACMARSRDRLAKETDAGKTTQQIQGQILNDLDDLIRLAQQAQPPKPPTTKPAGGGEGACDPTKVAGGPQKPGGSKQGKGQGTSGSTPRTNSQLIDGSGGGESGRSLKETAESWGKLSNRFRGPVLNSADESIVERYAEMIRRYYEGVATKATEHR